jgi:hypothetical protein
MKLFHYRVYLDSNIEVEASYWARTEGEAVANVYKHYPSWYSIELVNVLCVGRGRP